MKNFLKYCLVGCVQFSLFAGAIAGEQSLAPQQNEISSEQIADESSFFPELNLTQFTLKNGMTVWLKPTDFESDEVLIKLAAIGGHASIDSIDRSSRSLAAEIAWESGLGERTADEWSVFMYEHSLEFATKIQPFSRQIEGNSGKEGVEELLNSITQVFTENRLTEAGLKSALENTKKMLSKIGKDDERTYESAFLQTNTQNLECLRPLTTKDLQNVDLKKAESFFKKCFSDPSRFICIIVGSFDLAEMKQLLEKSIGTIPRSPTKELFDNSIPVSFPSGKTERSVTIIGRSDCLTRLTFPLEIKLDGRNIPSLEFMCQVIEARLRQTIRSKMKGSHGIDVSYEFPLYPLLDNPWISIRFRGDAKDLEQLKMIVLEELKRLQREGATELEILTVNQLQAVSNDYWLSDNFYWVSMLANSYFWNLSPDQIQSGESFSQPVKSETINKMIKNTLLLSNYSIVSGIPKPNPN